MANLVRVPEAARADLVSESIDLVGGEIARIAPVVEGAEGIQPLVAEDAEPFAQLAEADPQHVGGFITALAFGDDQEGSQALVDTPVECPLASSLDLPSLLWSQDNRLHGGRRWLLDGSFRLPFRPPRSIGSWGRVSIGEGAEGFESLGAKDTEPFPQLGECSPQELSDIFWGIALGNSQDGSETFVDTPIESSLASSIHLLPLFSGQDY